MRCQYRASDLETKPAAEVAVGVVADEAHGRSDCHCRLQARETTQCSVLAHRLAMVCLRGCIVSRDLDITVHVYVCKYLQWLEKDMCRRCRALDSVDSV